MATPLAIAIAEEVRVEMARQRVTGRQIAELLGISENTLSHRLAGRYEFRASELDKIARYLNVPITNLIPRESWPAPA